MSDTLTIDRAEAERVHTGLHQTFHDLKTALDNGNLPEAKRQLHNHHRYLSLAEVRLKEAVAVADGTDPAVARAGHDKDLPDPPPEPPPGG